MNVSVTLNVTSDRLEASETVLLYAMETVKRAPFQKKKSKLIIQLIWFQQQDVVAIWFAMALVAVAHVKLIVKSHVMVLSMMEPRTVTLVWPVKWIQTVLNVVLMLLLTNQHASVTSNVSDLEEIVSWFVPMVVLILQLLQLLQQLQRLRQQQPPLQSPQQLQRRQPLPQLQQRSVRDAGQLAQSIADHQSDLMIQDGSGRIPMTTVASLNCDVMKIAILVANVMTWNCVEQRCALLRLFVTRATANVHLDTLLG